jgi:hypothetical protein
MKKEGYKSDAQRKAVWASKNESTVWKWDEILEASDEELDALIEELDEEDLDSFVSEFNEISEVYTKKAKEGPDASTREVMEPRAPAEKDFVAKHGVVEKDHPTDTVPKQHDPKGVSHAPVRRGDKRNSEPMKSLKDIRK